METNELHEGFMSNQELANWFGIKESQMGKKKKYWVSKLSDYCDYETVRGGAMISNIKLPTYVKNKNFKIVYDNYRECWSEDGLDTCTHVGNQLYNEHYEELTIEPSTVIKHVGQAKIIDFGKAKNHTEGRGKLGVSNYVLCKRGDDGKPIRLTDEEDKQVKEILHKWFGSAEEKTAIVQSMVKDKTLSTKEAWEYYSNIMDLPYIYAGFLQDVKRTLKITLIRGTQIEYVSWFNEKPQEGSFDF